MQGLGMICLAVLAFVGGHFLLSHPLRRPIVTAVGERMFLGIYSLIAIATFVWIVVAYRAAPESVPLWTVGDPLWALATILMLVASILLVGSLVRNPAFPTVAAPLKAPDSARGVYAVTRHPMMWAFALWGVCHILIFPVAANMVLATAVIILALVGAALQDRKKERLQPASWPAWEQKTSYWPFAAIVAGKAHFGGFGWHALGGGFLVWLVATWAHRPLDGLAAGIWRWI